MAGCTANLLKGYFLDDGKLYCTEHDPAATVSLGGCRKCNQPVSLVVSVSRTQFSDLFFSYTPHDVCMHSNSLSPRSLLEPSLAYIPPPTASSTANYLLSHPLPFSITSLSFLPLPSLLSFTSASGSLIGDQVYEQEGGMKALGGVWHAACFVCTGCDAKLDGEYPLPSPHSSHPHFRFGSDREGIDGCCSSTAPLPYTGGTNPPPSTSSRFRSKLPLSATLC